MERYGELNTELTKCCDMKNAKKEKGVFKI